MGLLDDAIRQHLELKRVRGADPGEVIRQEREALGASGHQEAAAVDDPELEDAAVDDPSGDHLAVEDAEPRPQVTTFEGDPALGSPTASPSSFREQETAEVDMQAMLGVEDDVAVPGEETGGGVRERDWDQASADDEGEH
jgi:hypothetical protein